MNIIRTGSFSALFFTTFLVAGSAQVVMTALCLLLAVLSPTIYNLNGAPATGPAGAIAVVVIFFFVGLIMNAAMSAIGAVIVMGWRIFLPRTATAAGRPDVT